MSEVERPARGVSDLGELLATMRPELDPDAWVFATAAEPLAGAEVTVVEAEGVTSVLRKHDLPTAGDAPARMRVSPPFARITLQVHSDLEAVGLTAAVATALAAEGISANVVAGFFHDHVFVPWPRASDALASARALQRSAARTGDARG